MSTITVYCITLPIIYILSMIIFEGTPRSFRLTESQLQYLENAEWSSVWDWTTMKAVVVFWTWVEKILSFDVWILRRMHRSTQLQAEHLEAQHEAHRTTSGSTKQYSVDHNSPNPAHFRNSAIGSITDLPNYGQMVMRIEQECKQAGSNGLVRWFKMYTFVGQLISTVGKACWGAVVWKYCGFIQVCCGIWTLEGYQAMNFPDRLTQVVLGDDQSEEAKARLDKVFLSSVKCIVVLRSILFLAIPTPVTTVFSIFAQSICDSPFSVCQSFADHIPEYLKIPGYVEAVVRTPFDPHRKCNGQAGSQAPLQPVHLLGHYWNRYPAVVFLGPALAH